MRYLAAPRLYTFHSLSVVSANLAVALGARPSSLVSGPPRGLQPGLAPTAILMFKHVQSYFDNVLSSSAGHDRAGRNRLAKARCPGLQPGAALRVRPP